MLYGAGLRLMEALQLRIQDVDFDGGELTVRKGKGQKDWRTMLPAKASAPLRDMTSGRFRSCSDTATCRRR